MKSFFTWLGWVEFETTLGPFVVWVVVTASCWVTLRFGGWVLSLIAGPLWFASVFAWFAAFIVSIVRDHFIRAVVQLGLGLLCAWALVALLNQSLDATYLEQPSGEMKHDVCSISTSVTFEPVKVGIEGYTI